MIPSNQGWIRRGFTTVELIIVISIISILMVLIWPSLSNIRERAEKVVCVGHLRSLYCSFGAYLNDKEEWPQCEDDISDSDREQFWIDSLKDYGAPEKVWQCPAMSRCLLKEEFSSSGIKKIHYEVTPFDDNPLTPRRWTWMPWLVEKGNMHHSGALIIRSDGGVQTLPELAGSLN